MEETTYLFSFTAFSSSNTAVLLQGIKDHLKTRNIDIAVKSNDDMTILQGFIQPGSDSSLPSSVTEFQVIGLVNDDSSDSDTESRDSEDEEFESETHIMLLLKKANYLAFLVFQEIIHGLMPNEMKTHLFCRTCISSVKEGMSFNHHIGTFKISKASCCE